jgi:hypothetical protein
MAFMTFGEKVHGETCRRTKSPPQIANGGFLTQDVGQNVGHGPRLPGEHELEALK